MELSGLYWPKMCAAPRNLRLFSADKAPPRAGDSNSSWTLFCGIGSIPVRRGYQGGCSARKVVEAWWKAEHGEPLTNAAYRGLADGFEPV